MIRHCVFLKLRADIDATAREALFDELRALKAHLPGMLGITFSPNHSPEGFGRGFDWAFIVDFTDLAARDAYLVHPAHQAAGARLLAALEGGTDGLMVYDLAV